MFWRSYRLRSLRVVISSGMAPARSSSERGVAPIGSGPKADCVSRLTPVATACGGR